MMLDATTTSDSFRKESQVTVLSTLDRLATPIHCQISPSLSPTPFDKATVEKNLITPPTIITERRRHHHRKRRLCWTKHSKNLSPTNSQIRRTLRQQQLPSYRPLFGPDFGAITFCSLGVIFLAIGFTIAFRALPNAKTYIKYYTDCESSNLQTAFTCSEFVNATFQKEAPEQNTTCVCDVKIEIDMDLHGQIQFYYGLENFHQNFKEYFRSRDDYQLEGKEQYDGDCDESTADYAKRCNWSVREKCAPYRFTTSNMTPPRPYYPCGALANSLFNDTFTFLTHTNTPIDITREGLVDKRVLFNKFHNFNQSLIAMLKEKTAKPPNWSQDFYDKHFLGVTETNREYEGVRYEPFAIWMLPAALPKFKKLYGFLNGSEKESGVNTDADERTFLSKGTYTIRVAYNYPVHIFNGKKFVAISVDSWLGSESQNLFLSIAFPTVGAILLTLGIAFAIIYFVNRRKLSEMMEDEQDESDTEDTIKY